MIGTRKTVVATGLLALASHATAQVADACVSDDVCFQLNIPQKTADSGDGDIFFQLSGPSDYEWVALGQGGSMSGSNIFVIYTSEDGKNVTLSPRLGQGQREPKFNSDAEVTLLEGSGVTGGKMIANVRCSNCNSWSGGSADFSEDSGDWIYAYQAGGALNTDDQSASISQHGGHDSFNWDYANAKGGDSLNPLVAGGAASGTASGGASATSCIPRAAGATGSGTASGSGAGATATGTASGNDNSATPTTQATGAPTGRPTSAPTNRPWGPPDKRQESLPYCDEIDGGDGNDSSNSFTRNGASGAQSKQKRMLIAHGTLAALAFVIFFPSGAIAIRLASFPGVVMFHAAFQVFAYVVYIIAFGLGVYIASEMELLNENHPIIGIVVFIALFLQPIFGFLHHSLFKKYQTRTFWSYAHVWVGRGAITLGIINGGLGFKLADRMRMGSRTGMIVYSVVAVLVWLAWVAASVIGERRRKNARPAAPPKYTDSPRVETADAESHRDIPTPPNGHYAPHAR